MGGNCACDCWMDFSALNCVADWMFTFDCSCFSDFYAVLSWMLIAGALARSPKVIG